MFASHNAEETKKPAQPDGNADESMMVRGGGPSSVAVKPESKDNASAEVAPESKDDAFAAWEPEFGDDASAAADPGFGDDLV